MGVPANCHKVQDMSDAMNAHYQEGRLSYLAGVHRNSNPYSTSVADQSTAALDWAAGWDAERGVATRARTAAFNSTYNQNAARRGQYDT